MSNEGKLRQLFIGYIVSLILKREKKMHLKKKKKQMTCRYLQRNLMRPQKFVAHKYKSKLDTDPKS